MLMPVAEILKINDNYWLGSIPDVFQDYKNLWHFDISENMVTGTIPKTVFSSPELQLAYMSNCSLSGRIPNEYSKPPKLRDLYLNGNRLTGTVPSIRPGELTLLNEFLVYDTFIDGTMPESVCSLRFEHILDDLWSDCGGQTPEIECDFPDCCNRCFEGHGVMGRRLRRERPT